MGVVQGGVGHDVRLRECACVHCTGYGAVLCTAAVSCHVLSVYGALRSVTVAEDTRPLQPHPPHWSAHSPWARVDGVPSASALSFSDS